MSDIKSAAPPALRAIHHAALRCRDAAETRAFYEGILGLEFAGAFHISEDPADGQLHEYVHIFFKMTGGDFIAFFDDPASANEAMFAKKNPFDLHFAFDAGAQENLAVFAERFKAANLPVIGPLDHDFCQSVYTYDPNGFPVEVTVKVPTHDAIIDSCVKISDRVLAEWAQASADRKRPFFPPRAAGEESPLVTTAG